MDAKVGPTFREAKDGKGEDAVIAGKKIVWERAEGVERVCPGSADLERVQEGAHESRKGAGRAVPVEGVGGEGEGRDRVSEPRGRADNQRELRVEQIDTGRGTSAR